MALTKEDLQAIADLMDSKIQASETRMLNRMDQVVRESETRMFNQMDQVVRESEIRVINHVNAVVENTVQPNVKQIADGHKMLYEKMEREFGEVHEELDALNSTQAAQEFVLTRRLKQV